MNLNIYDNVDEKIDKTKTWISIKSRVLYSREIVNKKYTILAKRYDNIKNNTEFYIIVSDNIPDNKDFKYTFVDNYGRFKLNISSIWNISSLKNLNKDCNIIIDKVDEDDTTTVYYLDI